jgi:sugar phosphate isomerase/epimerase
MRLALSQISTVGASFAEDVAAYAEAGFDGIGIRELELPEDDDANLALLRASGLGVATCVPTIPSFLPLRVAGMEGPLDPAERIEALCASIRRFSAYEPESVLCSTGPVGRVENARSIVVEGLRAAAAQARRVDVRLGLEPAHPNEHDTVSFVSSIAETIGLLEEAGTGDVGLVVDTYNLWHESPETVSHVADRVVGLHVADVPFEDDRRDRVLPGETGRRSATLVRALLDAGWDGFLDVEIVSTPERFWRLPVDQAARRAYAAAAALVQTVP